MTKSGLSEPSASPEALLQVILTEAAPVPQDPAELMAWGNRVLESTLRQGERLILAGHAEAALALYEAVIQQVGPNIHLLHECGTLAIGLGLYEKAIDAYLFCLEHQRLSAQGKFSLAHSLVVTGDSDAEALLRSLIVECPEQTVFVRLLADLEWLGAAPENLILLKPSSEKAARLEPSPVRDDHAAQPRRRWILFSPCPVQEAGGGQHPVQMARSLHELGQSVLFVQLLNTLAEDEPFTVLNHPFLNQFGPVTEYQWKHFEGLLSVWNTQHEAVQNISGQNTSEQDTAPVALFYSATPYLNGVAARMQALGYRVVYWSLDDLSVWGDPVVMGRWQQTMVATADTLLATAKPLQASLEALSNKACHYVPNGFRTENFPVNIEAVLSLKTEAAIDLPLPADWHVGKAGTCVYWGNLSGEWLDLPLLQALAQVRPDWTFHLIGLPPESAALWVTLPNVFYLGEKPVSALRAYGLLADVALIPFKNNAMTQTINPVKVYEYLACGLPVVSTPLGEIAHFPGVHIVADAQAAAMAFDLIKSRSSEEKAAHRQEVSQFLTEQTWEKRALALIKACPFE